MKIPLSDRLQACCSFVHPGDRVADIGCDHGYLGIYLLKNGIASSVIAADIREGPLQSAVKNSEKFGVGDKMTFYLSDGVRNIPRAFDTLVCAGMGGDTMVSILSAAPWLKSEKHRLILQCQTKTALLRKYLSENGWCIQKEAIIRDGKFLYTVMEVIWQDSYYLTPGQCYFPPALSDNSEELLRGYYRYVVQGLENIVLNRKEQADPFAVQALEELKNLPLCKENTL
ncbi:MAG: SAM-dependent methyltransferase [Oscillospiraceae bacterium]|nr:SAM-dependent methyltransferase [Oscillospiraceae bacterium]